MHRLDLFEDLGRARSKSRIEQFAARNPLFQGLRNCARLFVNFLEHEVAVLSAFHRIGRQVAFPDRPRHGLAQTVEDSNGPAPHFGQIAFLQKHEAARDRQQCGDIGCREVFVNAQADDGRTSLARHHDALRIRPRSTPRGHRRLADSATVLRTAVSRSGEEAR